MNKRKVPSFFIDNIWDAELPYMHLIRNFNEGFKFLLRVIDIYSKYAWVIPLKDKKGITITNAFQKMLGESKHKPNKMSVDKDNEFHNRSMKSWLEKNAVEMHSARNEEKSGVAERFIRILKNIISKSKNVYIDKLNDIVNKCNNIYHSTIKMKPVDVNLSTHIDFSKEVNDKDPKFKFDNVVRISKYKNIFAKAYIPNWSEGVYVIKKVQNTVPWTYVISDLNGEENAPGVYTSKFAKRVDLVSLKSDENGLDIDKLKNVPTG